MGTGRTGCPQLRFSGALLEGSALRLERDTETKGRDRRSPQARGAGPAGGANLGISIAGQELDPKAEGEEAPAQGAYQSGTPVTNQRTLPESSPALCSRPNQSPFGRVSSSAVPLPKSPGPLARGNGQTPEALTPDPPPDRHHSVRFGSCVWPQP